MYVCVFVCMHVCIYICMYVCIYLSIFVCMYVCLFVCMFVSIYICLYVCMFVCLYKCMYVRLYVWVYYVCTFVRLHVCTFVCLYVWMYYVCTFVCLYVWNILIYDERLINDDQSYFLNAWGILHIYAGARLPIEFKSFRRGIEHWLSTIPFLMFYFFKLSAHHGAIINFWSACVPCLIKKQSNPS